MHACECVSACIKGLNSIAALRFIDLKVVIQLQGFWNVKLIMITVVLVQKKWTESIKLVLSFILSVCYSCGNISSVFKKMLISDIRQTEVKTELLQGTESF